MQGLLFASLCCIPWALHSRCLTVSLGKGPKKRSWTKVWLSLSLVMKYSNLLVSNKGRIMGVGIAIKCFFEAIVQLWTELFHIPGFKLFETDPCSFWNWFCHLTHFHTILIKSRASRNHASKIRSRSEMAFIPHILGVSVFSTFRLAPVSRFCLILSVSFILTNFQNLKYSNPRTG